MSMIIASTTLAATISSTAFAASFDCNRSKSVTEKTVCEHQGLNDADVKMATTYQILRRLLPMGTRSIIQNEQVKWLELRDQCLSNKDCLINVYQMRQQKLEIYLDRIYKQGPY